ncbi:MAG TPA: hypothetical protein VLC46_16315 [Thermoanaerobaculia bacterium]|jgi:hypothetical protein|nr:hypothetical protein [Thermoanaerobaculia bacterium]
MRTSILVGVILIIVCSVAGAAPTIAQHPKASNLQQATVAPNDNSAPKPMLVTTIAGVPSAHPKPDVAALPTPTLSQWALILLCVSLTGIALRKMG